MMESQNLRRNSAPGAALPRWRLRHIAAVALVILLPAIVPALGDGPASKPAASAPAGDAAKIKATLVSLDMIKQALNTFEVDQDRFPTTAEGLEALVHQPAGTTDWHPYLEKLPSDAWGHPFVYRCPSTTGKPFYDLYSIGPDGKDGTADDINESP